MKETQDSSLSVSTSVAVARRFKTGRLVGALGAKATAPAARSTTRRAIALLVALRVRLASRRHAAVHSLDCSTNGRRRVANVVTSLNSATKVDALQGKQTSASLYANAKDLSAWPSSLVDVSPAHASKDRKDW